MNEYKEYLTKEKLEEFKLELVHLKTVRRKEVAENLESAKSLGDLSENAEYQEARELQATIEERIMKIESILKNAIIVEKHQSDTVDVGSTVIIKKDGEKANRTFTIVGSEESNTSAGKISLISPLGKALMKKKKGESFSFSTPAGEVKYTVVGIE